MTTEQIIRRFLGGTSGSNGRISTDGANLYSYSTLIAFKDGASVYVTTHKYSATTDRQVQELWWKLDPTDETVERPVSVRVVDSPSFEHQDTRIARMSYWLGDTGRKPRKGSVGYRPVDDLDGGHVATFKRAIPRAV